MIKKMIKLFLDCITLDLKRVGGSISEIRDQNMDKSIEEVFFFFLPIFVYVFEVVRTEVVVGGSA